MAHYTAFEDLPIWQHAREICKDVYALTSKGSFARDFSLKDQINRSSGSCMDNIAEGFERDNSLRSPKVPLGRLDHSFIALWTGST